MRRDFRRYFQVQDKQAYFKIIEGRILDSIIEFLDLCNVDTSALTKSSGTIVNSGIFMSGGEINAGSIVAGEGNVVMPGRDQRTTGDHQTAKDLG